MPTGQRWFEAICGDRPALDALQALLNSGFLPTSCRRRGGSLWIQLSSEVSSQHLSECLGAGVVVRSTSLPPLEEEPPGTDWIIRAVGIGHDLGAALAGIVERLVSLSETVQLDLVEMKVWGENPVVLDIRVATEHGEEFSSHKPEIFEWGESNGLCMLVQRLTLFKRRKKLVCFDLDSTLVEQELIVEVARKVGKERQVSTVTRAAMEGEMDYDRSFVHRVAMLRGVSVKDLEDVWYATTVTPGAHDLISSLRGMGIKTCVISGAFSFFTERARELFGLDFAIGNDIEVSDGILTGNVKGEIINGRIKVVKMREVAESVGATLDDVVAVGDGANDVEIIKMAGTGIAYDRFQLVKPFADGLIPKGQLPRLLFLLRE